MHTAAGNLQRVIYLSLRKSLYIIKKHKLMRKLLHFFLLCLPLAGAAQENLKVISGSALLHARPETGAPVLGMVDTAIVPTGEAFNDTWYQVSMPDGTQGYMMHWDVMEMDQLDLLREKRITPSASTLFRLMRYFKNEQRWDKAEDFSLRIINLHNDEEFPTEADACFKLGHLAYIEMISNPQSGIGYNDFLYTFTQKVIAQSSDPAVLAMAHYHAARYLALNGKADEALDHLLIIVRDFPSAYSRNECQPGDADSWFYRPDRCKRLLCALGLILPPSSVTGLRGRLDALTQDGSDASRAFAAEMLQNIGQMPYPRDASIWY